MLFYTAKKAEEVSTMKIVVGLVIILVLLISGLLALPFLIDLASYQDQYKPLIEDALNRKIKLQGIRLAIWPRIGARITGFTVLDDPAFSESPFASLSSLDVGVKLLPLLGGQVEVEQITLRDPIITVIKNKAGVVNISTIGPKTAAQPSAPQPGTSSPPGDPLQALAMLAVDRVSIDGGNLTYRDLSTTPTTEYQVQNLGLLLKSVHLGEMPILHLDAILQPYNLPVKLDGSFGPLVQTLEVKQYDFTLGLGKIALALKGALTGGKLDATVSSPSINTANLPIALPLTKPVTIKDFLMVTQAPYPLKQGVAAMELADVTTLGLDIVTGNSSLHVKGTVLGGHAKVMITSPSVNTADLPIDTGLKKPVDVKNLEVNADLKGQEARLSNLSFELFNGQAKAQGATSMGSPAPPFNGKVTIQGVQLGPALLVISPDSKLSVSGTAAADIALAGRGFSMPDLTRALEGPGHLEIKDGKIEGVNLVGEAAALLKVAGISLDEVKATAFSILETDFMIKQGIVDVQKLLMDSRDFQATGKGTVGFDHTLNLAVNMNLSQILSQKIAGSSPVAKVALKEGRLRLPLLVTGTIENPSYGLDIKGFTEKAHEQVQEKVKGAVEGLLQGTTKPEDLKQQGKDLFKDFLSK
jgi:AsmA protein